MKSIRGFLVIVLLAIITLANFAAALRGYLGSMDEAEQRLHTGFNTSQFLHQVDRVVLCIFNKPFGFSPENGCNRPEIRNCFGRLAGVLARVASTGR